MGLFKSIGNIVSTIAAPVANVVQDIVHQPVKAIADIANLPITQGAAAINAVGQIGGNNIPVISNITQAGAAAQDYLQNDFKNANLPTQNQAGTILKGAATAGAIYAGGAGLGAVGALGAGSSVDALLKKQPGSLNSILSTFGGDYGGIAASILKDPYAPKDASGNIDVEGALQNAGYDKANKALAQTNAAKKSQQSYLIPLLIAGGLGAAYLLLRRK